MGVDLIVIMGIIIGRDNADGVHPKTRGMLGKIDGRISIGRADVHDNGDSPPDAVDNLLGDLLSLVNFHHHTLAMSAQGKKSMDSGRQVEVDDRIRRRIDGAVILESHRHGHQDSFKFLVAWHKSPFYHKDFCLATHIAP